MATRLTTLDVPPIFKRYADAWLALDPDAIVALHTSDSQFQAHGRGGLVVGREALRHEFAQAFERYPNFGVEVLRVLYGDAHWTLDWNLTFQPPGQDRRKVHAVDIVEVAADGLVSRKDTFFDFAQLKAAMETGN